MALADYTKQHPDYQYYVDKDETVEGKVQAYKEFLMAFKQDCTFSITSKDPAYQVQYLPGVRSTAFSTSNGDSKSMYISLSSDKETNLAEYAALRQQWVDVLELSLVLDDKWNGTSYSVFRMLTLDGKRSILSQFVERYQGSRFDINSSFGGGTTFRLIANTNTGKQELLIDYLPQRVGEAIDLERAFEQYTRPKSK